MRTSIATVSLSGSLEEKLRAIAKAGFDAVEIFEPDLVATDASPAEIGALLRDEGLACCALQPFRDFEGLPEPLRQRTLERAKRKFDLMAALGTDLLLVCSSVSPHASGDRDRIVEDFRALGELAQDRGLRVGYEALAWGRHVFDHRQAWQIVKAADHPAIGLILDSFHSLARAVPSESLGDIDLDKVFLVQLADAPAYQMDLLSWSRHFRCMPGEGDLAIVDYVGRLIARGYDGLLSLEIFNDLFRATSSERIVADGMRSLRALIADAGGAAPVDRAMPPRSRCDAVEFVEFAAAEDDVPALEDLFRVLGFRSAGGHINKQVDHWVQGDINLVLNREPDSFAQSYARVHGASVCALGLRIQDVSSALDRAKALGIETFTQSATEGELQLPAVRAVGGSVLYFLDYKGPLERVWSDEFRPHDGPTISPPDIGLRRIDHISQVFQEDELLSWLLYYWTLLEVQKKPQADIIDPKGLIRARALESEEGGFRILLSESAAKDTLQSRFVSRFFGPGVQYVALACDDVFQAAQGVRNAGGQILPIPANYYDDLGARFGLEPAFVERLAAADILYDRNDAGGEYLHFYLRAYHRRVFFAVVERRGYDGYDPFGTQIRLAAQARFKSVAI